MKKLTLIILITLTSITSFAAKKNSDTTSTKSSSKSVPRFTANYYKQAGKGEMFNGKSVTLYITSAMKSSSTKEGYEKFECETRYDSKSGGTASIYVPEAKANVFFSSYGKVKSRSTIITSKNNSNKTTTQSSEPIKPYTSILHFEGSSIYYMGR